jgi:hypothetical protein
MSGTHEHKPFEGHMHDFEAHIRAVEEDLEYYRAKRLEPRIIYLIRRNVVSFYNLLKARKALKRRNQFFRSKKPLGKNIEARVRYLEEWLDDYVKGIALVSARAVEAMDMVTEDNRKERGDYDEFFRITKKEHKGTLEERMVNLEQDLKDYQELLEVFCRRTVTEQGLGVGPLARAPLRSKSNPDNVATGRNVPSSHHQISRPTDGLESTSAWRFFLFTFERSCFKDHFFLNRSGDNLPFGNRQV